MRIAFESSTSGRSPLFIAAVSVALAAMALVLVLGWLVGWTPATRIVPSWPQTVPATAATLLCIASSLYSSARGRYTAATTAAALALAMAAVASGLSLNGWVPPRDWLGLPAPATLIAAVLLATAAGLLARGGQRHTVVATLGMAALALASVRLLQFAVSGPLEEQPSIFDTLSVPTAIVIALLGAATLLHPSLPFARMMAGRDSIGRTLRWGLLCVAIGPVLQAFVVSSEAVSGVSLQTRLALAAVVLALMLGVLLYAGLQTLQHHARERTRLMVELLHERDRLKALVAELEVARDRADVAMKAKNAFLAHMSHEIRTPLNAVIGLSQLLARMPLAEKALGFVRHINQAGEQLLALTSDVLDLSRIEAGEMQLELVAFEPQALVEAVLAMVRPQADAKGLPLRLDVGSDVPNVLMGDPLRLRQVLINLVGNAVKFTEQGSVTLRVQLLGREDARATLQFAVIDTGIGIAPEQQSAVFQPFTQADASTTRRYGGTGLGLSIVQRLVDMMDGRLQLDSIPGKGSTFSMILTMDMPPSPRGTSAA